MKKVFFLFFVGVLISSCSSEAYFDPFIVTGTELIEKNKSMSNYYEKGQNYDTIGDYVIAPTGKFQIGDTIFEASIRYR
jgi:hypothetical protein